MRSILAKAFVYLMMGLVLANLAMSLMMTHHMFPAVTDVLLVMVLAIPIIMPLLAGLVWDEFAQQESQIWILWLWVILPLAMLVVVVAGLIIDPPDNPGAWMALSGVVVWNVLLPIGRLIGKRIWRTTQDV